jgi:hypothetical protein
MHEYLRKKEAGNLKGKITTQIGQLRINKEKRAGYPAPENPNSLRSVHLFGDYGIDVLDELSDGEFGIQ